MKAIDWLRDVITTEPESPQFKEGYAARMHGAEREDNPHPAGINRARWFKGWDAFDDWAASQV